MSSNPNPDLTLYLGNAATVVDKTVNIVTDGFLCVNSLPAELNHVTNKLYVDDKFLNVVEPTGDNHVTSKSYVDDKFLNVVEPTSDSHAANKLYVDTIMANVSQGTLDALMHYLFAIPIGDISLYEYDSTDRAWKLKVVVP